MNKSRKRKIEFIHYEQVELILFQLEKIREKYAMDDPLWKERFDYFVDQMKAISGCLILIVTDGGKNFNAFK